MMTNRKLNLHYFGLTFLIAIAIILRFWNLELKPLWMDEVITAIFSLGKNYSSIPLDVVFPLENLRDIFSYQTGVSCPQIAQNVAVDSTHPPLYFCGMYALLGWMQPLGEHWVSKLRSPSVWFGVALVVAVYFLNRLAFSRQAGLMGAAIVAVSPFAVYLSQEARHYTLPMLTISLSLLALIQIQRDIFASQLKIRIWVWLLWTIINSISIYIHYFCIIAFIAQVATLLLLIWRKVKIINIQIWLMLVLFNTGAVVISLIPWFWVIKNHLNRSETSWLPTPQHIEPLYQTLISWVSMVIVLPVEKQPLPIIIISALLMIVFAGWLGWKVFRGIKLLLKEPHTRLSTITLLSFTAFVLLGMLIISYVLGKDITVAPRYNFIYYPSFSALIAASVPIQEQSSCSHCNTKNQSQNISKSLPIILIVSFISCIFVVSDLAFQKPYLPQQVAQNIYQEPPVPVMAVMAYSNYQDVALGLSFALALEQEVKSFQNSNIPVSNYSKFAFFNQKSGWQSIFEKFSQLPDPNISQLNLWIFAPGRLRREYPEQMKVSQSLSCNIDINQHYRIGIPYQLYRCNK
ncbi:glycosyltransferase family 39 protein [Rivularia sp. UHCC 0363]|nr:glycosyltransferase family 39 protein [Rivularia sp. UHCC 0363]MEA5598379.1 glycosyltransferase family 39 protein [Rivularia sp. UHCC 0363]